MIMTKEDCINFIKLDLGGNILELELSDDDIGNIVDATLTEICRYYDQSIFVTVPFSNCISFDTLINSDHNPYKLEPVSIVKLYRIRGFTGNAVGNQSSNIDPMYAQQWLAFSSGGMTHSLENYLLNYMSYSTLQQIRNNISTDLAFKEDKIGRKLYINSTYENPANITIEFIPAVTKIEQIVDEYWLDIAKRLSLAYTKRILGRIRTRFTQSNALWTQDGETMLAEGNEEIKEIREILRVNSVYFYPID